MMCSEEADRCINGWMNVYCKQRTTTATSIMTTAESDDARGMHIMLFFVPSRNAAHAYTCHVLHEASAPGLAINCLIYMHERCGLCPYHCELLNSHCNLPFDATTTYSHAFASIASKNRQSLYTTSEQALLDIQKRDQARKWGTKNGEKKTMSRWSIIKNLEIENMYKKRRSNYCPSRTFILFPLRPSAYCPSSL